MSNFLHNDFEYADLNNQNQQLAVSTVTLREGDSKRRDLLQSNQLEDLNYKHSESSEVNRSFIFENIVISKRRRDQPEQGIILDDRRISEKEEIYYIDQGQSTSTNGKIKFSQQLEAQQQNKIERHDNTIYLESMIERKNDSIINIEMSKQLINRGYTKRTSRLNLMSLRNLNHIESNPPEEINGLKNTSTILPHTVTTINNVDKIRSSKSFFWFQRTQFVKKFVELIKQKSSKYLFRHMREYQFEVLADPSVNFNYFLQKGMLSDQAIYKRGIIMKSREEIFKKFFKSKSKIEMLILLIYVLSFLKEETEVLKYVITCKIFFVISIIKNIFHKYDQGMRHVIPLKVLILILVILTFSHTQAMIFANIGLSQENGWIKRDSVSMNDYSAIYITSIYWSIITMATVGYGDIHPVTKVEMVYVSIVSLISCGIYGYGLNSIGKILTDIQSKEEKFNKKMQILNLQMNSRNIDKSIQHTVRKYFEYLIKEEQADDEFANQMINTLPQSMKERILFDANHKILYSQKIFQLNFSKQFLDRLSLEMKTIKLGPEIDLFDLTKDNNMRVYFILKGAVEMSICQKSIKKRPTILRVFLQKLFLERKDHHQNFQKNI